MAAALLPALWGDPAAGQADPVEDALTRAGLDDVLEAHLIGVLERETDESARAALVDRIAGLYARLLRELPGESEERGAVVDRAGAFVASAPADRAVELRLALLLERYLPIERRAGLHELELLGDEERARLVEELTGVHAAIDAMARNAADRAALAERRARADAGSGGERTAGPVRERSLTAYYAGWSGLTLSVLEDGLPSSDVLRWFGWPLGADGETPTLDRVDPVTLEYEHVARAAIGVGRALARRGESTRAVQWLRMVAESERAEHGVRVQATVRLLRVYAEQGDWIRALELADELRGSEGRPLAAPEARFLAIAALRVMESKTDAYAERVAKRALQDLIEAGEIGHVLDLRRRFRTGGLLGTGFIGAYAEALDHLEGAERAGTPGLYQGAAQRLTQAAALDDAKGFPVQRDDALLKAAYCEIRAGRPREAEAVARSVLKGSPTAEAAEEARWLVIVSIDAARDPRDADELMRAVRRYIDLYPGTERANRLIVRHAGTDVLEPGVAIAGLRAIGEDEPVVLSARRALVRLVYRAWIDGGRREASARDEIAALTDWIWARESRGDDPGGPRDRLDVARIALDAALGGTPQDLDRAERALGVAERIVASDPTLARFNDELALRAVEVHAARGRFDSAEERLTRLRQSSSELAPRAERLLLAAVFDRLDAHPGDAAASALGVRVGVRVAAALTPPAPERLSADASRVVDRVWRLAAAEAERTADAETRATALRLARVVLDRGLPTAQGMREMADLARRAGDAATELEAWSVLLGASRPDEAAWWEARYETLRLLVATDRAAALRAYEQHRVLHPLPGLSPWSEQIDALFAGLEPIGPEGEAAPGEPGVGS